MAAAARIAAALGGNKQQREGAYDELTSLARAEKGTEAPAPGEEGAASIAKACVLPMLDSVLCADPSTIDQVEYLWATNVLGELAHFAPMPVLGEFFCDLRNGYLTGGNYAAVCRKDPAELTRGDAMVISSGHLMITAGFTHGIRSQLETGGIDEQEWFSPFSRLMPHFRVAL